MIELILITIGTIFMIIGFVFTLVDNEPYTTIGVILAIIGCILILIGGNIILVDLANQYCSC